MEAGGNSENSKPPIWMVKWAPGWVGVKSSKTHSNSEVELGDKSDLTSRGGPIPWTSMLSFQKSSVGYHVCIKLSVQCCGGGMQKVFRHHSSFNLLTIIYLHN